MVVGPLGPSEGTDREGSRLRKEVSPGFSQGSKVTSDSLLLWGHLSRPGDN